jgi:ribonuclease VapC
VTVVLDSSALLALLWSEPGNETVRAVVDRAMISAVNLAEVVSKLSDRGFDGSAAREAMANLRVAVVGFDEQQAMSVGNLRKATRHLGLSIGDRACLALAQTRAAKVLTSDRTWTKLGLGIDIVLIR